jgi:LacI family transcriptional regulator
VKRAGIKDVAREAGVSVTTVSKVLNGHEGTRIAEGTRLRVLETAQRLNYTPSAVARTLRTQESQTIGFVSDRIATTPFAVEMIKSAQEVAWERGYLLFLMDTGGDPQMERAVLESLLRQQVAGIVYACMYHRVIPVPEGLPPDAVLLDARADDGSRRAVVPDDHGGALAAVRELLDHGHRRIAYLDTEDPIEASLLRYKGYEQALRERGVAPDPALHLRLRTDPAGGLEAAGRVLELPAAQRPTALFCFNDRVAMGAYRAGRHRGLQIPQDLSIVGFDDQQFIASDLEPPLTTVALPHAAMGRWAIETLLGDVNDVPKGEETYLMPCPLVRRKSVAPPPGGR